MSHEQKLNGLVAAGNYMAAILDGEAASDYGPGAVRQWEQATVGGDPIPIVAQLRQALAERPAAANGPRGPVVPNDGIKKPADILDRLVECGQAVAVRLTSYAEPVEDIGAAGDLGRWDAMALMATIVRDALAERDVAVERAALWKNSFAMKDGRPVPDPVEAIRLMDQEVKARARSLVRDQARNQQKAG